MLLDELIEVLQEERKTKGNIPVLIDEDEPNPETIKGVLYLDGLDGAERKHCESFYNFLPKSHSK